MSLSAAGGGGGGGPDPEACSMAAETVRDQGRNRNLAAEGGEGRAQKSRGRGGIREEGKGRRAEQVDVAGLGSSPRGHFPRKRSD